MSGIVAGQQLIKKTTINRDFARLNKLIYGWPKSGKSTFCSTQISKDGRQPLFIPTEDGLGGLSVFSTPIVTRWEGFKAIVDQLTKDRTDLVKNHSCIVLDLVTDLDLMCVDYISKKYGVSHPSDLEFGKGWFLLKQEFQPTIRFLMSLLPVTFVTHTKEKEITWQGEKMRTQSPALSMGSLEYIGGKVDLIAWFLPVNAQRAHPEITMKSSTTCIAGCRYPQLVRDFIFYPAEPKKTYDEIQLTFEKGATNAS
jgi:hypothetical protein